MNRTLSLAAALAACALLAGCTAKDTSCNLPTQKCGDRCLDVSADPQNCGACGNVCAPGSACCNRTCVDVLGSDENNCGACGQSCGTGTCSGGTCACPNGPSDHCAADPWPWCRDLATDRAHCGDCAISCGLANETCSGGACGCFDPVHPTTCAAQGTCADLALDPDNCGTCGTQCKAHAKCSGGSCGCTNPAYPDSCPTACVNFLTDAANCGDCGATGAEHVCTGTSPVCARGMCCPTGQTNCSGACVDTRTSSSNCGTCGNVCTGQQTCAAGTCGCRDPSPRSCGTLCCAGTACCGSGTSCQTAHSNGVGGSFYDCTASYSTLTRELAVAAANTWQPAMAFQDLDLFCAGNCLARQTSTSCAMWCWQGTFEGRATSGALPCAALCNTFIGGGGSRWP